MQLFRINCIACKMWCFNLTNTSKHLNQQSVQNRQVLTPSASFLLRSFVLCYSHLFSAAFSLLQLLLFFFSSTWTTNHKVTFHFSAFLASDLYNLTRPRLLIWNRTNFIAFTSKSFIATSNMLHQVEKSCGYHAMQKTSTWIQNLRRKIQIDPPQSELIDRLRYLWRGDMRTRRDVDRRSPKSTKAPW